MRETPIRSRCRQLMLWSACSPRVITASAVLLNRLPPFPPDLGELCQPALPEGYQRIPQRLRHCQVTEPFLVGRDDKPWRLLRTAMSEDILISGSVVIPALALLPIGN